MSMSLSDGFWRMIGTLRSESWLLASHDRKTAPSREKYGAKTPDFQPLRKNESSAVYGSSGSNSSMLLKTTKSASLGRKSFHAELFVSVATTTSASTADVLEEILWTR